MSFTKLLSIFLVVGISGCSSNPNYYKPGCRSANPVCLAIIIATTIDGKASNQNCADMTDEKRKYCEAQVESLKKHISDANKK
jgi:hypothetical protein